MGLTWDDLITRIHGRLPDGRIVEGVEVFRQLYGVVGFGWVVDSYGHEVDGVAAAREGDAQALKKKVGRARLRRREMMFLV
jgi:hypothetical protein